MKPTKLIDSFQKARSDQSLAVIEGVQGLKHAVRFNADVKEIITYDIKDLKKLLDELAPDVAKQVASRALEVDETIFNSLSPRPHHTKVIALAKRKAYSLSRLDSRKPVVFLENPKDLENIGAVIRVSTAAGAAAVIISGPIDIWHPSVIRGAAGLHFALPVLCAGTKDIQKLKRPLIAMDPDGEDFGSISLPENGVYIFGTERHGISTTLLKQADKIVRLRMQPGVSSLNLATSVAATLYRLW